MGVEWSGGVGVGEGSDIAWSEAGMVLLLLVQ